MPDIPAQQLEAIRAELSAIESMTVGQLQDKYLELFGMESRSHHRTYLQKKLAYRVQELRLGGLDEASRGRARVLAQDARIRMLPPRAKKVVEPDGSASVRDRRLPPVGAVLTKDHGGEQHQVTVLADGFEYRGERYRSLSRIAKAITGTDWNGFLFFGLAKRKKRRDAGGGR